MKQRLSILIVGLVAATSANSGAVADVHRVVFSRVGPFQSQLFMARGDGSEARPLAPGAGLDYSPSLSYDKQWVVFTSERAGSADIYRMRVDGTGIERLTDHPAYDDQAVLSPDGKAIAFVSSRDTGRTRIWLLDLGTRRARPLTQSSGSDFRPAWSPDGQWIAFTSDRDSRPARVPGGWEDLQALRLYVIRADGTGLRGVTQGAGVAGTPKWSPDGARIVYYETTEVGAWFGRRGDGLRGETQLVSIDVRDGRTTQHTTGPGVRLWPQMFSDGRIAYLAKNENDTELILINADGHPISGAKGALRNPSWSVDGAMVVYHKIIPAPGGFQLQRAFSSHPDFELTRIVGGNFPAWSPDGEYLALGVTEAAGQKAPPEAVAPAPGRALQLVSLQIMKPDGSDRRVLFNRPGTSAFAPAWSPDGTQIAFSVGRYFRAPGHPSAEVAIIKADGTAYRALTRDDANNGFPSWSPDGKRLVYKRDHHLVVLSVGDNSQTVLTQPGPQFDNFPQWSPKGDWIVFTSDRERSGDFKLYLIRPNGSGLRKLTDSPGDAHPIWSPDGEWIMYSSGRMGFKDERVLSEAIPQPYGELFIVHPDGTGLRQLTDNQWEDATAAWMPRRPSVAAFGYR